MDDLENLKVADLKNELKRRGLPVGGNKSELVQRLQQHLLAEESQILQGGDSITSGDDVDDSLLDTNEDALLGITSDVSKMRQPQQPAVSKATVPTATKAAVPAATKVALPTPKVQVGAGKIATSPVAAVRPVVSPQKPAAEVKKPPAKPEPAASTDQKQTVNLKEEIDVKNVDAKMRRAEKFNTGISEEDKKQLRAQKFGIGVAAESSTAAAAESSTAAAQKSRAERFGISVKSPTASELEEKKKSRAERFGLQGISAPATNPNPNGTAKFEIPSVEQTEMLKKRAERFGLSQTETIQNLGSQERLAMRKKKFVGVASKSPEIQIEAKKSKSPEIQIEVEAKKAKRAERFGV